MARKLFAAAIGVLGLLLLALAFQGEGNDARPISWTKADAVPEQLILPLVESVRYEYTFEYTFERNSSQQPWPFHEIEIEEMGAGAGTAWLAWESIATLNGHTVARTSLTTSMVPAERGNSTFRYPFPASPEGLDFVGLQPGTNTLNLTIVVDLLVVEPGEQVFKVRISEPQLFMVRPGTPVRFDPDRGITFT